MSDIMTSNTPAGTTGAMHDEMENIRHNAGSAVHELRNKMGDVKRDVRELASTAGMAAREQLDPVEDYIRRFPLRAMLISAGVGLVLGMFFKRSR